MFNEAEQKRVEAEQAREAAEAGRAHAEQNTGSGRVEQEAARVEAEKARVVSESVRKNYESELEKLRNDPGHYITPGARKAFNDYRNKAIVGYLILAVACIVGIYSVSKNNKEDLKAQINMFATQSCLASTKPGSNLHRYNDLIETQIEANRAAREINLDRGDRRRADLNTKTIIRLQKDKIDIPTEQSCYAPIIK